jgi:hypothetical protein
MKQAIIISGFPGIGKSYITKNNTKFKIHDSDSSEFSWMGKGVRHPDFPQNYMNHILSVMYDYDIIFVSSHKIVREALIENGFYFYLVYPCKELKQEYLRRYRQRGNEQDFIDMLNKNWDSFIDDIEGYIPYPESVYVDRVELSIKNSFLNLNRDIDELKVDKIL